MSGKCITAFILKRGLFWYTFFGIIVDFEEEFKEKHRKINKLYKFIFDITDCQIFLAF